MFQFKIIDVKKNTSLDFNLMKKITIIQLIFYVFVIYSFKFREKNYTENTIFHEGRERTYLVHLPTHKTELMPVLFCLHGGGGTAEGMIKLTQNRFNELADNEGFIVVYPQGFDKGWNDGRTEPFSTANREHIDDAFLSWMGGFEKLT